MFFAYVDDSNIHDPDTGKPMTVGHGGGVSSFEQWKLLEQEWKAAIVDFGVKCFHMTDFEKYQREFSRDKGWTEEKHKALLNRLLKIIKERVSAFVGYSVPSSPANAFVETHKASIRRMLLYCSQEASRADDGRIGLIFAKHPEVSSVRIEEFLSEMRLAFPEIASFAGASPSDCCALQAADLLAYEFVRWRTPLNPFNARYPIRFLYSNALQTFHVFHA